MSSTTARAVVPRVKETPLPLFAPQFTFLSDSQDNLAWAVFGELSYDFTDRFEGSVALRYDNDERENTTETPTEFIPAPINCQHAADAGALRVYRARCARRPGTNCSPR